MRNPICSSICMLALLGCASPQPAPVNATTTAGAPRESGDARAQRLINHSVETGEPINTADGKKIICKRESVTNTRLKDRKICMTQDEWLARSNNAKEGFHEAARQSEFIPRIDE